VKQQRYRDTKGPSLDGMVAAKRAAASHRFPAKAARDVALIRLMHDMGLRRGEVVGLDLDHVDIRANRLSVLGKARREREWRTIPAGTLRALEKWIGYRDRKPGPLFTNFHRASPTGSRITPAGVNFICKEIGKAADVTLRPHGIRHSSITTGLNLVKDPRAVQRHARHASLETTMIYDDNIEDLAGQVAKVVSEALEE
jgi:integrase/recombinase XerC